MPKEGEPVPISAIQINLKDRSITFEAEDKPVARVSFAPEGTIFFQPLNQSPAEIPPPPSEATPAKERQTTILHGKLKSQPKEGKVDSRGNPTAWARLAAHEEGREDAHLYLASFHRHTTAIALKLPRDAQVTVEGYPHLSTDPSGKKMDTFSVINLVNYPGKQDKGKQ